MPRASPIAVIMLTMKNDSEVTWPEDRGDGDGHDDGQDRDAHREERGHQGAEDQDQHDHRGREPELQLPVGQVGLRELGEVVVEGVLAGDVDLERGVGVGGGDLVDHVHDPGLGVVVPGPG